MKNFVCVIFVMFATLAVAQVQGHLDVRTTVQKEEVVVNDAGEAEKRLVPAEVVVPGESVFYTITFTNVSAEPADNVVITNPIAEDLMYVEGSAFGPGMDILFSVDGGETFAAANELTVVEDGEVRNAEAADFTHVRWVMQNDLEVGAQGTARFAAVLE
ncbi:MAG: hypothetical protein OEQ90_05520 [Gammaproteobacteria bacterium]|nr:hypothetical protein [Gammaproteobacteria bacterium]